MLYVTRSSIHETYLEDKIEKIIKFDTYYKKLKEKTTHIEANHVKVEFSLNKKECYYIKEAYIYLTQKKLN